MPAFPAAATVPGALAVSLPTSVRNTFTVAPPSSVEAQGQGIRPRTWLWICPAGFVQSMMPMSLVSMGA